MISFDGLLRKSFRSNPSIKDQIHSLEIVSNKITVFPISSRLVVRSVISDSSDKFKCILLFDKITSSSTRTNVCINEVRGGFVSPISPLTNIKVRCGCNDFISNISQDMITEDSIYGYKVDYNPDISGFRLCKHLVYLYYMLRPTKLFS